jgi:hypothetical protein
VFPPASPKKPILVNQDLIILDGHQRVRALALDGIPLVEVVRVDRTLAADLPRLLASRKPMTRLPVPHLLHFLSIPYGRSGAGIELLDERHPLRPALQQAYGLSERTLDRYCRVLALPPGLFGAYQSGQISLVEAASLFGYTAMDFSVLEGLAFRGFSIRALLKEMVKPGRRGAGGCRWRFNDGMQRSTCETN